MNFYKIILTIFALFFVVSSCQENDPNVTTQTIIEFEVFDTPDQDARVAQEFIPPCESGAVSYVFLRIVAPDGTMVWEGEVEPKFFPGIGRWQLQVPITTPGTYLLEEFMVMDENGTPIYAIPHIGSEFGFVPLPLPFEFEIRPGEKIINYVAVYCFMYGEAPFFGIKIIDFFECWIFRVWFFVNFCDDFGHHFGRIERILATYPDSPNNPPIPGVYSPDNNLWYLPLIWCFDRDQLVVITIFFTAPDGTLIQIERTYSLLELFDRWSDRVLHISEGCD
jgi:hypothetical protein